MSRTVFLTSRRKGAPAGPGDQEDSESPEERARVSAYPAAVPDRDALDALGRLCDPALGMAELERTAETLRIASVVTGRLQTPEEETVDAVLAALERVSYALALERSELARFQAENVPYGLEAENSRELEAKLRKLLPPLAAARALLWLLD